MVARFQGQTIKPIIGRFPEVPVAVARKKVIQWNNLMAQGIDPRHEKQQRAAEPTLDETFNIYYQRHCLLRNKRPDNQQKNYRLYLRARFGKKKLSDIQRPHVLRMHEELNRSKSPRTANIALVLLRAIYNKAISWELWEGKNPADNIEKFKENRRERFLLPEELQRFFKALKEVPEETSRDAIFMLLYTGARKGNVLAMEWAQIDFNRGVWRIPDTKSGDPVSVQLLPDALDLLASREHIGGQYVFPSTSKTGHLVELKRCWDSLCRRAELEDFRVHDLRHTKASYMAIAGESLPVIAKALGHKNLSTTSRYAHLYADPVIQGQARGQQAMLNAMKDVE